MTWYVAPGLYVVPPKRTNVWLTVHFLLLDLPRIKAPWDPLRRTFYRLNFVACVFAYLQLVLLSKRFYSLSIIPSYSAVCLLYFFIAYSIVSAPKPVHHGVCGLRPQLQFQLPQMRSYFICGSTIHIKRYRSRDTKINWKKPASTRVQQPTPPALLFVPRDLDLWPLDPKRNGYPRLIVEHLCV